MMAAVSRATTGVVRI